MVSCLYGQANGHSLSGKSYRKASSDEPIIRTARESDPGKYIQLDVICYKIREPSIKGIRRASVTTGWNITKEFNEAAEFISQSYSQC